MKEGRETLLEPEALELCRLYGIPISEWRFAENADDAARLAKEIGFPVAMKVVTPELLHKSEIGGVVLGLRNSREVKARFRKLVDSLTAQSEVTVLGVILQEQVDPGLEAIIGSFHDTQFGPCMMLGLGGVLAEAVPEVTFRLIPLSEGDAAGMLAEVAGGRFLAGQKGHLQVRRELLIGIILSVSKMVVDLSALDSVELNPLVLYEDRGVVVDAKVSLKRMNR